MESANTFLPLFFAILSNSATFVRVNRVGFSALLSSTPGRCASVRVNRALFAGDGSMSNPAASFLFLDCKAVVSSGACFLCFGGSGPGELTRLSIGIADLMHTCTSACNSAQQLSLGKLGKTER